MRRPTRPAWQGCGGIRQSAWTTIAGGDVARTAGSSTDYLIPTGIRFGEGIRWSRGFFGQWNGRPDRF